MPVYSRLTVINGVLREFGRTPVATIEENSDSLTIDDALDLYLPLYQKTSIDYNFLFKNVTLSAQVIPQFSEQYQSTFQLPADYLRLKQVYFAVAFQEREPYILTNAPFFTMDYFAYNGNYETFPSHFMDSFIYFCALKLAMPMTRQAEIEASCMKAFSIAQSQASATEFRNRSNRRTLLNPNSKVTSSIISY